MFASVRNPNQLGFKQPKQLQAETDCDKSADDGSNVGILTAMALKRRQL